jgi:hypothetical protein
MLIETDINELGDKRLNPEEAVFREREELLKKASVYKISGQAELEDAERSAGPRITWRDFLRRLSRCNPHLLFKDAQGGNHIAIYRLKYREERERDGYDPTKAEWWNDHKYVGGFQKIDLPEYSHLILDSSNLPIREYRGWRSVLMALIKNHAISYNDAKKEFGDARGERSQRWHEQLRKYK